MTLTLTSPAVIAAARQMCARYAKACGVNGDDAWNVYAEEFKVDALAALEAAGVGELVEAARVGQACADLILRQRQEALAGYPHKWRAEQEELDQITAALAKFTGA